MIKFCPGKKNSQSIRYALGIIFFLIFISCGDAPYHLQSKDQTIIDSLSNKEINSLSKNLEDSCNNNFQKNVKILTDSIVEFQIKSIEKQLSPYRQ
ncbi:MAG: hypothetical protein ACOYOA_01685 [Saprospiraceae bacterium]